MQVLLVRDLLENKNVAEKVIDYVDSLNKVVIWETKVDKRSKAYEDLKEKIEFKEFALAKDVNFGKVFDIYKVAKSDGERAVKMLAEIEEEQEPMMFCGLLVSQVLKDYSYRYGAKEKRVLKKLSELDMELKSSKIAPWVLIKAFLLRLKTL